MWPAPVPAQTLSGVTLRRIPENQFHSVEFVCCFCRVFSRVRLCECWNDKLEEMPFLLPGILASHISSSCPENFAELIERTQTGLTFAYTSQCPYSNANEFICICMHTHVRDQNTYIHL